MADGYISQIKTPDNKVYLLKDSQKTDEKVKQTANTEDKEFPIILKNTNNTTNETNGVKYAGGVTVNPSDKTVTAMEFIGNIKAGKIIPTIKKTYTDSNFYGTADSEATCCKFFISVKPDGWYKPWQVRFKVRSYCPDHVNADSVTWCTLNGRADSLIYANWNEHYDTGHYYIICRPLKNAGFNNGLGHAVGVNIRYTTGRGNSAYYRTIELDYYDCENCTVTILDNAVLWENWTNGTDANYNGWTNLDAVNRGLRETSDDNDTGTLQMHNGYFINNSSIRMPTYTLFGFDREGKGQAISLYQADYTGGTVNISTSRVYNTKGIDYTRGIYHNSGGNYAINAIVTVTPRIAAYACDFRYTDNCVASGSATTLGMVREKPVYFRGTIHDDGLFYLAPIEVTYNGATYKRAWVQDIPTTADGYVYWFIGYPYYNSSYAASLYQINLHAENPLYWFHHGRFEEYNPPVVEQIGTSEAKDYPILLKYTNDTDNEINYTKYSNNVTTDATATKPFTFNPSTGNLTVTQLKIGTKNDNMGLFPNLNNWNQIGSGSLYWYRSYINNYYGGRSHVDNWDSGKNIGTASSASAAAVLGTVNFYNTAAAGATQTKTLLTADSTANSNITITLPKTTGTLALKSELPTLSGLSGIGTINASGTAPLTLSGSKSGTTYTLTGSIADANASASGVVNTDAQTFSGVKTFDNGLHIYGTISTQGTGSVAGTMYPGGAYHSGHNSIVLHGDTAGISGIGFTSEKATKSGTTTNINGSSDRAFIQYHAYGVTPAAEGTAPTLATSGELGTLVIGVGNDATDTIRLQAPGNAGILHQIGATAYPIPHTTNTNGSVGGTTTPVYVDAGVIKALSYTIAKSVPADAVFTDHYAWGDITGKPTKITLTGAVTGNVSLGAGELTLSTSVNHNHNSSYLTAVGYDTTNKKIYYTKNGSNTDVVTVATLRTDMGLSNALHFIGITSTTLTDGSTTATLTAKSTNSLSKTTGFVDGDVVMDGDQLREYVWSGSAWRLLGITTSTAYTQPTSTATNTWIAQISQGTDGKITATTGSLNTSGTWSGKANTAGTADKISNLVTADQASSSATWRRVWISYSDNVTGRPAWTDNLVFQTSTNTLKTTKFQGALIGNADSATTSTWTTLLKPIASTTTASASTWNIPSGSKQVWGERFSDSTLKYTPSGGSETTVTDTGDWTMWLTSGGTSNAATFNMRIDGTYYGSFSGNLSGNATTATKAGVSTIWLYPENNNEINFGGTNTGTTLYFGYRAKDSRPIPAKFVFGSSTGTADLQAKTIYLGSGTSSYISSTQYTGNAATATTATNLANNPSIQASTSNTNQVTISAGGKTSSAYTIPYATSAGSATNAAYLTTPSITTEENIESGTRAYQGSGSGWTGSVTSMAYAGILQVCGGYSRGWQIWATRGNDASESLHWRNPIGAATAWNTERIILDSGNTHKPDTTPTLSWGAESTVFTLNGTAVKVKAMAKPTYTYSDVGAAPSSTVSCTTANVKSALGTVSTTAKKFLKDTGSWAQVDWGDLTGVPSSFSPSSHTHSYIALYEARASTTTLNKSANYVAAGAMFHLVASSSTSATDNGKTPTDANVLQMNWDNSGGYDAQLGIATGVNRMYFRARPSSKTAWDEVAHAPVGTTGVGNSTQPVYMTSEGVITACTSYANASVNYAASAGSVAWANTGHPSTFPPTIGTTSTTAAAGDHTHTISLTQAGTSTVNLAANTVYTLTAGGSSVVFKTPADGNTDTKVNVTATAAAITKNYLLMTSTAPTSSATGHTALGSASLWVNAVDKGKFELVLGNATATTTAGGQFGQLALYSASTAGTYLKAADGTTWKTQTLQAKDGTIALTSDIPTNLNQLTNGPGYTTNTGTVTSVKLIQGAGITVSSSGTAITTTGERTISITGMDTTNGSTTKWLNQKGGWSTPTAANVGALASSTVVTNVAISANTVTNANYPIVFATSNTGTTAAKNEGLQKSGAKLFVNPSTGTLYSTKFCVDESVTLQYNTTDQSLDFIF